MDRTPGAGELVLDGIHTLFSVGTVGALTDGQLLDRFVASDASAAEPAFAALVERHGPMVLGVCRRTLRDAHAADDAFQATFLVLARRARSIRRSDSVGGWLHRVARRVAARARNSASRRRGLEEPLVVEVAMTPQAPDPLERDDLRALLDEEIDRLRDGERQALVLCDLEGQTYEQAAARLRWPLGTVKSRLSRARDRLRSRLVRRGVAPAALAGAFLTADASAAVTPALAGGAVRLALTVTTTAIGGSATIRELANGEIHAMIQTQLKLAAGAFAVLGTSIAVTGLAQARRPEAPASKARPGAVEAQANPTAEAKNDALRKLSASGRVVDAAGHPIAGATVFLREWAIRRAGSPTPEEEARMKRTGTLPDILAQTETDRDGHFAFEDVPPRPFPDASNNRVLGTSWFPWDLVVMAKGQGLAWVPLTLQNQREPVTITLPEDAAIRGSVTNSDGKPIAGVRLRVFDVAPLTARIREFQTTEERLCLHWSSVPIEATTGTDGHFEIKGLPPRRRLALVARADGYQQESAYAATTTEPQPDLEDTSIQSGRRRTTRHPVHTGGIGIRMKPTDHRLVGQLLSEATGKPVAGARVLKGFERQGRTDAEGRFQIEGLAAGSIELHLKVDGNDTPPLDIAVEIPADRKIIEQTFRLPRGVMVSGRVVDDSGRVVAGASLRYEYAPTGEGVPTLFGLVATTDADGRFRIAVPAGQGAMVLQQSPPGYLAPATRLVGSPPAASVSRPVQGASGETVEGLNFTLSRGRRVAIVARGPDGREPLANAELRRYGFALRDQKPVLTDGQGRGELAGIDPRGACTIDIVHPGRKLGRRLELAAAGTDDPDTIEVTLEPLGTLEGMVLDEGGNPLKGPVLWLRSNVKTPELLGVPIASTSAVDPDGTFHFDGLVPAGTYYVDVAVTGHAGAYSEHVETAAGTVRKLEPFRLPATSRTLKGQVVDPRGQPVAGATVSFDQSGTRQLNPGGRWFMDTDASGRFQLTNLPRGPLTIMAFRSPTEPDRNIRNLIRVTVDAAQNEVRVELPDARRRLQGIED